MSDDGFKDVNTEFCQKGGFDRKNHLKICLCEKIVVTLPNQTCKQRLKNHQSLTLDKN